MRSKDLKGYKITNVIFLDIKELHQTHYKLCLLKAIRIFQDCKVEITDCPKSTDWMKNYLSWGIHTKYDQCSSLKVF